MARVGMLTEEQFIDQIAPGLSGGGLEPDPAGGLMISDDAITFAKMANLATDRLIGRDTAGTGDPEALTVGGGIEFTGTGGIQSSAFTGDATKAAGGVALTLATVNANTGPWGSATQAAQITLDGKGRATAAVNVTITPASTSVTFSATARLLGRVTAGAGAGEEISLGTGIEFSGSTLIRSALTGDATASAGSNAITVVKINGVSLAGLATGILKNTTATGAPSIAVAADFPTLNQNTTGSAAKLTTARTIAGNSFDGTANITIADTDLTGVAWISWTPTWTNLTVGNGTVTAKYKQVGKTVFCRLSIVFGTTTSITGTGVGFTFPVTRIAYGGTIGTFLGNARFFDSSASTSYEAFLSFTSTTVASPVTMTVSGGFIAAANVSATAPFTWATSDEIETQFFYEAA